MANIASKKQRERRKFLQQCAAISLLGSGAGAMNGKLGLIGSALAQECAAGSNSGDFSDYKALVCVFLYGGSDSFSMFLPTDDATYNRYAASRAGLAVPRGSLLNGARDTGIAFNPLLRDLHNQYNRGRLAVVANVGNLIAPVTKNDYSTNSALIPNDLFAHNHQQEQWLKGLSSSPASVVGTGWGGRMADLMQTANAGAGLPPSFSLAGSNYWLPGADVQPMSISPSTGLSPLTYLDAQAATANGARSAAFEKILAGSYTHPMKAQAAMSLGRARDGASEVVRALAANDIFRDERARDAGAPSSLRAQLRMVARMIAANEMLGMRRQIFFVGAGGWDTHDSQTPRLNKLLSDLNGSLSEFQNKLDERGLGDSVTTFTASDFGRTLTINGDGSDHGWSGHYMVMGGAVNGGQLFGQLPSYAIGAADDTGDKGRVIPNLSINQYGATMAKWMGVSDSQLCNVFPDLANFGSDWQSGLSMFS